MEYFDDVSLVTEQDLYACFIKAWANQDDETVKRLLILRGEELAPHVLMDYSVLREVLRSPDLSFQAYSALSKHLTSEKVEWLLSRIKKHDDRDVAARLRQFRPDLALHIQSAGVPAITPEWREARQAEVRTAGHREAVKARISRQERADRVFQEDMFPSQEKTVPVRQIA